MDSSDRGASKAVAGRVRQRATRKLAKSCKTWRIRSFPSWEYIAETDPVTAAGVPIRRCQSFSTKKSAEMIEIEIDGDGVTLRGIHVNSGRAGGKVFSREIELESGASDLATTFIGAAEIRMAGRRERFELLVFAENLNIEIFPQVIETVDEAIGTPAPGDSV